MSDRSGLSSRGPPRITSPRVHRFQNDVTAIPADWVVSEMALVDSHACCVFFFHVSFVTPNVQDTMLNFHGKFHVPQCILQPGTPPATAAFQVTRYVTPEEFDQWRVAGEVWPLDNSTKRWMSKGSRVVFVSCFPSTIHGGSE